MDSIEDQIQELNADRESIQTILASEEEALSRHQKELQEKRESEKGEHRTRSIMETKIKKHTENIDKLNMECIQLQSRVRKLENQNKGYEIESIKLDTQIKELQKQQGKYGAEASTAHARFYQTVEELKIKNSIIDELQKKNVDLEVKLKYQQSLYESVRSDRNMYSKNLIETQQETSALQDKFMMMTHQIVQLKEELKRKDELITKECLNQDKAEKQKNATENQAAMVEEKIKCTKEVIKLRDQKISDLKYTIAGGQVEKQKQLKDHEMVLNERDILGAQLIKRNQELDVLHEKIKISHSNLSKGEKHFREKENELDLFKKQLESTRQELSLSQDSVIDIGQFKSEINSLEKEILKEKTKNRALEDELQYPMNVHRWKKMEATDPENYERIMKIQTLQRRVITKTEEVKEKDKLIKEKEQLFFQLKNILARQPGPEVKSQIEIYQSSLKDKTSQLKKMLNELKYSQAKAKASKYEIGTVNEQIASIKQNYFKKRDTEEKTKLKELQASMIPQANQNRQAYLASLGITEPVALGVGAGGLPTVSSTLQL